MKFATPKSRALDKKRKYHYWEYGGEEFPRMNFAGAKKSTTGKHTVDFQTGEVRDVEECAFAVVDALLDDKIDPKELAMGHKVEKEHTDDPDKAEEIAKDHLREPGHSRYYARLKKCGLADELEECDNPTCSRVCPRCHARYDTGLRCPRCGAPANLKVPPKADIMPGGGIGGPIGDNTAIGVGGGGGSGGTSA